MGQSIQSLIAQSVDRVMQRHYPQQYHSLCQAYAVVGANVISVVLNRVYRPVAGLAVLDCGDQLVALTDNAAFANPAGGAFHCWIESADESFTQMEVVDLMARHFHEYARAHGARPHPNQPEYLWGTADQVLVRAELDTLPASFGRGQAWLRETDEGWDWMTRHIETHMNAYIALTSAVLRELQASLPAGSTLLTPGSVTPLLSALATPPAALTG